MRRFIVSGLAVLLSAAASAPVFASDPDSEKPVVIVVAPEAGDARRLELASRYLELTVIEAMNKSMSYLIEELIKEVEDSSEEEQAWARRQFPIMMTDMIGSMVERMAPAYAERLSEAELEALVGFFETPTGRSISRHLVEASVQQQEVLAEVMIEAITEYEAKYCAAFDCDELLQVAPQKERH